MVQGGWVLAAWYTGGVVGKSIALGEVLLVDAAVLGESVGVDWKLVLDYRF